MSEKNTGGPAYPLEKEIVGHHCRPQYRYEEGMTLRDYFAGQALSGLTSATNENGEWMGDSMSGVAHEAYAIADAMLKERSK